MAIAGDHRGVEDEAHGRDKSSETRRPRFCTTTDAGHGRSGTTTPRVAGTDGSRSGTRGRLGLRTRSRPLPRDLMADTPGRVPGSVPEGAAGSAPRSSGTRSRPVRGRGRQPRPGPGTRVRSARFRPASSLCRHFSPGVPVRPIALRLIDTGRACPGGRMPANTCATQWKGKMPNRKPNRRGTPTHVRTAAAPTAGPRP
jgi:hypothetical protein